MAIEILMPAMSAKIRVGRLSRWLVAPGDMVSQGDVLAEIETETATMEVEAVDSGRIVQILIPSGSDAVAADTPIALIDPGSSADRHVRHGVRSAPVREFGYLQAHARARGQTRVKASPLARRRARALGVALDALRGSGPGGRIIARDVDVYDHDGESNGDGIAATGVTRHVHETIAPASQADDSEHPERRQLAHVGASVPAMPGMAGVVDDMALARQAYAPGSYIVRPHDPRRHAFVDRLEMAHAYVPQLTLHTEVRFDELERALGRMNTGYPMSGHRAPVLSISDVLVKAMGLALRQVPEANVSYTHAAMLHHGAVDVAVALLGDDAAHVDQQHSRSDFGFFAPLIVHADLKSLSEISQEILALREMAARGDLDGMAMGGGVSTIIDLNQSVVSGCDTLVTPPQSSVLVMGAAEAKAVVVDGALGIQRCARMSLCVDQRAIDARVAMQLLAIIKAFVEDPMRMLV
ncbi:MAG TPA: 2-oxo acid dehydrogenase subunit E2 [Hyphomicrobiaceae bacterium]|nr:2-oxo acid dehydrogenase subunit E2 [Hyphomicrobiaceae bacterium]